VRNILGEGLPQGVVIDPVVDVVDEDADVPDVVPWNIGQRILDRSRQAIGRVGDPAHHRFPCQAKQARGTRDWLVVRSGKHPFRIGRRWGWPRRDPRDRRLASTARALDLSRVGAPTGDRQSGRSLDRQ